MASKTKTIATMTVAELQREYERLAEQRDVLAKQIEQVMKEVMWRVSRGRI